MQRQLTQTEFDDLSAYLDGELSPEATDRVRQAIETDEAWARAHQELTAIDAALDSYVAPQPAADLPERIVASVRKSDRKRLVLRIVAWVAPAAAAAAGLLIVLSLISGPGKVSEGALARSKALAPVPQAERPAVEQMIVENMGFFQDYEVVENYETLEAIDHLEHEGT